MSNYSVYIITSPEGKRYVGMTMRKVKYRWNNGKGYVNNKELFSDINKFGWESFNKLVVQSDLSKEEACRLEQKLILEYDTQNKDKGYNIEMGGVPSKLAEQTKRKMSNSHIGLPRDDTYRRNISKSKLGKKNGMYGKRGALNPTARSVNAYLDGKLVLTFPSMADAVRECNLSKNSFKNISACCQGKRKTAYGFVWRYCDD